MSALVLGLLIASAKSSFDARQHGWTVVSIKNDWKTVFADR